MLFNDGAHFLLDGAPIFQGAKVEGFADLRGQVANLDIFFIRGLVDTHTTKAVYKIIYIKSASSL